MSRIHDYQAMMHRPGEHPFVFGWSSTEAGIKKVAASAELRPGEQIELWSVPADGEPTIIATILSRKVKQC